MATHAPFEAYTAAKTASAWLFRAGRGHLVVKGPDRVSFLQGMVTNDVEALPIGESCSLAFLTAKGAMVSDGRLLKRADALHVDVEPQVGESVRAFLEKYLISEEAELQLTTQWAVLSLFGPQRDALLAKISPAAILGPLRPAFDGASDWLVSVDARAEIETALGDSVGLSGDTFEVLRIEAGVPVFGVDLSTSTIPLEANLEHAIAYKKGCYIGQEVIARATYRGQMNKKLVGLLLDKAADQAAPQSELRANDKRVGFLTSVAFSPKRQSLVALGFVHRDFVKSDTELMVSSGGVARVVSLPF